MLSGSGKRIPWLTAAAAIAVLAAPELALANNVSVIPNGSGTKVTIQGDDDANDVTVTQSGNMITITGNNGTTIGPQMQTSVTVTAPDKIVVRLNDGADKVDIDGVTTKKLIVESRGSDDDENITIQNSNITKKCEVFTGSGDDTLTTTGSTLKNKTVDLGTGQNTETASNISGDKASTRTGDGDDTFVESNVSYASVKYEFGDGINNVALIDGQYEDAKLKFGSDDDVLVCAGNEIDKIQVKLEEGNDVLSMTNDTTERASLDFGPGDDEFFVQDTSVGDSHAKGKQGEDCLEDLGGNDFGEKSKVTGFELDSCNGVSMSGRAVILDFDTGPLAAGEPLCLSDIVAGGCTFTGPECVDEAGTPLEHLHDFIAIVQAPDEVFLDPNGGGCGHGEVVNGVLGCGPDTIPLCVE